MDEKMHFITEPEELLNWMKEHEEFKVMNTEDAQILLNYMEGHDYRLGTDKEGNFVRVDINSEKYEAEKSSPTFAMCESAKNASLSASVVLVEVRFRVLSKIAARRSLAVWGRILWVKPAFCHSS